MFRINFKEVLYVVFYSLSNATLSFIIIYIINNTVSGREEFQNDYMGIVFVSVIIYTYLLNICFQKWLNKMTYDVLYKNEKLIFQKILNAPLAVIEKLGSQRFYTAIEDLRFFSSLPEIITHSFNSLLMLVICLIYLFTISTWSALMVIAMICIISFFYFFIINRMAPIVNRLREHNEFYFKYLEDVVKGFKGLKLSSLKSENLMNNFLIPNRDRANEIDFNTNFVFLTINLISQYGLYLVIGTVLFILPIFNFLNKEDVISYVMILMFISGPINGLINMQGIYTRLFVAKKRITQFFKDYEINVTPERFSTETPAQILDFNKLGFEEISYNYNSISCNNSFKLGPINLFINRGETIFIVGGNGSGKSTFINILTGLYQPSEGNILLNNLKIDSNKTKIQDLIAAVFTDSYIYSNNYDSYSLVDNKKYQELLEKMELNEIVLDQKESSARRIFSKGQTKRMSLILALLEEKPILVLDEWAADQDPYFRKYFYETLLPKLKEEGKTIIAVTHDDMYFKHADRIIKFDSGKIVRDTEVTDKNHSDFLWH